MFLLYKFFIDNATKKNIKNVFFLLKNRKTKKIKSVSEFFAEKITVRNTVHEVQYSGLMIFISKNNYIAVYPPSTGSAIPVT